MVAEFQCGNCGRATSVPNDIKVFVCCCNATAKPTRPRSSPWATLHQYAIDHAHDWDATAAAEFYRDWYARIPGIGCRPCHANWDAYIATHPPDLSSADAFFAWSVSAHNHVSIEHCKPPKPAMSLADARLLYQPSFDATYLPRPRLVQLVKPQILHPLPTPRSDRALCVIAVDARSQSELAITRPLMRAYAARLDIDYIEITDIESQEHPVGNKYAVLHVAPRYAQTLLIDADVVITPESPDIFGHVPVGSWAMVDDLAKHTDTSWLVSEMRGIESALELPELPVTKAWNSGVCIMPTDAELVYHPPPRPVPYTWCAEQHYHTLCLHHHIADGTAHFVELSDTWNAGWPWLDWPELIRRAHFLHVNGCVHPTRLDFLRHLAAGRRDIPDELAAQCFRETPWCEWARARAKSLAPA